MSPTPRLYGLGILVALGGLTVTMGPWGVLAGVVVGATWVIANALYGVTVGTIIVGVSGAAFDPVAVGGLLVGLGGLYAIALVGERARFRAIVPFVAWLVVLGGVTVAGIELAGVGVGALLLLGTIVAAGYAIHRVEQLRLGHLEGSHGR